MSDWLRILPLLVWFTHLNLANDPIVDGHEKGRGLNPEDSTSKSLKATIPTELGLLTNLQYFSLGKCISICTSDLDMIECSKTSQVFLDAE